MDFVWQSKGNQTFAERQVSWTDNLSERKPLKNMVELSVDV